MKRSRIDTPAGEEAAYHAAIDEKRERDFFPNSPHAEAISDFTLKDESQKLAARSALESALDSIMEGDEAEAQRMMHAAKDIALDAGKKYDEIQAQAKTQEIARKDAEIAQLRKQIKEGK